MAEEDEQLKKTYQNVDLGMTIEEEYLIDITKEGKGKVFFDTDIRIPGRKGNREESLGTRFIFYCHS